MDFLLDLSLAHADHAERLRQAAAAHRAEMAASATVTRLWGWLGRRSFLRLALSQRASQGALTPALSRRMPSPATLTPTLSQRERESIGAPDSPASPLVGEGAGG